MKNVIFCLTFILLLFACEKKEENPIIKYSVIYSGNGNAGGSVPIDNNLYDNGSSVSILGNDGNLVKTGYSFVGWNSASDGKGTDYLPESVLQISNANVTLFAKWIDNSSSNLYQINYNGNGSTSGFVPIDNTFYISGAQPTVKYNTGDLSKNGNTFKNWNISASGNGQSYSPGDKLTIQSNITLYAIYNTSSSGGKYNGFNSSGQVKSKSSLTSSWISQDLDNTFGTSSIVSVVWDGSKYIGFNSSGQVKSKSSLTSSWISQDLNNTFGTSSLVSVVWAGSKYVGFNASGQVKSKSSLTSSWISQDLDNTFGTSSIVSVVWDGSKYIGFNASGQVKSKSSLTSSWISQDLNNTFGTSSIVSVVWDGSKYIGFNSSGQVKSKSSLTSSWISQDLNNTFGTSSLVSVVFN